MGRSYHAMTRTVDEFTLALGICPPEDEHEMLPLLGKLTPIGSGRRKPEACSQGPKKSPYIYSEANVEAQPPD